MFLKMRRVYNIGGEPWDSGNGGADVWKPFEQVLQVEAVITSVYVINTPEQR